MNFNIRQKFTAAKRKATSFTVGTLKIVLYAVLGGGGLFCLANTAADLYDGDGEVEKTALYELLDD